MKVSCDRRIIQEGGGQVRFRRVLLKLSGEALMGAQGYGIDPAFLEGLAQELAAIRTMGVQLALVVGGGNIFRGMAGAAKGMDRVSGDQMGMLATVINALALRDALERAGAPAVVQSALAMPQVAEGFSQRQALVHLEHGRVVIFAAGTGNPYFTTDTAASLRAAEIQADVLIKATKVDGVYEADPKRYPEAKRFDTLTYSEVLARNLGVMDLTAITLCREQRIPVLVFSMMERGTLAAAMRGEPLGTLIEEA
ncbi:MAG: UMP kinase [Magnetococcales bacterium]|nr:UMP kinase [Magnetococcales bacterium]